MMAALAISSICNLAPSSHRDARKSNVREHDILLSRILKDGRASEVVHHVEQHSMVNVKDGICSCGMGNAASTSGQSSRQVLLRTGSPPIVYRKLQKKLSMKKAGKNSRPARCRDLSMSLELVTKASEKWGIDMHIDDIAENIRRQKRRAALAALALAGCVSIMLPSSASAAEALMVDIPAPSTTVEALEAQFKGSTRMELEKEVQIQRKEWETESVGTTAPSPTQGQNSKAQYITPNPFPLDAGLEDPFYAWKQVQKEMGFLNIQEVVCVNVGRGMEDDSFYAWRQIEKEMGYEGAPVEAGCISPAMLQSIEDDPFYAWKQIQKEIAPLPKSPVKKAVAASVAVAVAGSVAGAASAASRAVASSGGTSVVSTSLTVLQHSALPGSTLLARIAQHLGGGGVAGAIGATAVYPLDTIKTRMQAQSMEGENPQYKDEIDCFKQLVTKEGPASLYSGLVPQLLGIAPEKAMKLTVNEALLSSLETMMPGARVWALEFIAGGGGGASQVVFTNPMEIVKVRLQTQKDGAPKKALWTIVKELGVKGLYDGAGVTLARDVPSSAIFFAIYTLLRGLYPDQSFLAGAIAAIPATVLVTPMDIIKTRLQKEPSPGEPQYTDWWVCMQDIVTKEGPQALFKGSLLRVLRTSPQFGITLMVYGILCDGS